MAEYVPSMERVESVVVRRELTLVFAESDEDFWRSFAERMDERIAQWWADRRLYLLRSACAGVELRNHTALWGKDVVDVVRTL